MSFITNLLKVIIGIVVIGLSIIIYPVIKIKNLIWKLNIQKKKATKT